MQSYWSKALAKISTTLMISVSLTGCDSESPYPSSTGGGSSTGSGTLEDGNEQPEPDLSGIEQKLDFDINNMESAINLGNEQLARGLAPANCDTVLIVQTHLQELVINGRLSASNSTLVRIKNREKTQKASQSISVC